MGFKYFKVGVFAILIIAVALLGSPKMQYAIAGTGSGLELIKKVVQLIKIRSSDKPRSP